MSLLSRALKKYPIILPEVYKDFYSLCSDPRPKNLIGTDLWNDNRFDLMEGAVILLEEDGIENFLEADDFVFMMHQGYMFWYFKANGDPNPIVHGYYEGRYKPDSFERFSDFIKEFTE